MGKPLQTGFQRHGLRRARENSVLLRGLDSVVPLLPALKQRASIKRPSGAGFSFRSFLRFAQAHVLTQTLGGWLLRLGLVTALGTGSVLGQSNDPGPRGDSGLTYHSASSEVRLVFFATDERNRLMEVEKGDFAVVDNGMVIRDFRSFTRSAALNLDLVVLIDASESVLQSEQETRDILELISCWPWSPGDNVSVLSFSGAEVRPICASDCRNPFRLNRVSLPAGGVTPLFDAVESAANMLMQRRTNAWPVVILLSDGLDTNSRISFEEARERISASEAQIYAIDVGRQRENGTAILQRFAEDSGGRYVRSDKNGGRVFSEVLMEVGEDLRSARVVTYALPESGAPVHSVRILPTNNLSARFRSRRSYYRNGSGEN